MEFGHVVVTKKSPADASAAVKEALTARKFSVLFEFDFGDKFRSLGLPPLNANARMLVRLSMSY